MLIFVHYFILNITLAFQKNQILPVKSQKHLFHNSYRSGEEWEL